MLSVFVCGRRLFDPPSARHGCSSTLVCPASGGRDPRLGRDPQRDAVQPAPDRLAAADRTSLTGQDQERRLRCILGVVLVVEYLPADAQDHRSVAIHQRREGCLSRLVPLLGESLK